MFDFVNKLKDKGRWRIFKLKLIDARLYFVSIFVGYDFFAPVEVTLEPGETVKIPTGIRVEMEQDWVLKCYPRSGLGFKYRLQLNNTVGIIDSDYFYSDNEGHIFAKLTNDTNEGKTLVIPAGTGFMQGIFVEYGITVDDAAEGVRNGGFGSTTK